MKSHNILLACDTVYYDTWALDCIRSIQTYLPYVKITIVIINPNLPIAEIDQVRYVYDYQDLPDDSNVKLGYYQACRFIKCAELFDDDDALVISLDVDSVCCQAGWHPLSFELTASEIHVLQHYKHFGWLAGFVSFGKSLEFRKTFRETLLKTPISEYYPGIDQTVLNDLSSEFDFLPANGFMTMGKEKTIFYTVKGNKKYNLDSTQRKTYDHRVSKLTKKL